MKKILIIVILSLLSLTAFAQIPFKIHNKDIRFKWGSDSMRFDITGKGFYLRDTIYFADGTKQWSADTVGGVAGNWSMSGLKIYPTTPGAYVNTDSSYYIKGVDLIRYNTLSHNINIGLDSKNTGYGNSTFGDYSFSSNTTGIYNTTSGLYSMTTNTTGDSNTAIGAYSLFFNVSGKNNCAFGVESLYLNDVDSNNIAIGYKSGHDAYMSDRLWIGQGDSNNAIIYGEMLTRPRIRINGALNVKSVITNGGLINRDTVLVLVDDATFSFPATSVGWAEIQCDSLLIEKTWGVVSWNGDGSTSLRSNGAKFVNTDIDGNYACFYDGGAYAILRNTSGSTQTYSIKYHYHN